VFFLLISKLVPPNSLVVPLISKFLLFTFLMNIFSVLNTCIVINLHYKKKKLKNLNPIFRTILFRFLPKLFVVKREPININKDTECHTQQMYPNEDYNDSPLFTLKSSNTMKRSDAFNYGNQKDVLNFQSNSKQKKCSSERFVDSHEKYVSFESLRFSRYFSDVCKSIIVISKKVKENAEIEQVEFDFLVQNPFTCYDLLIVYC
jgi:hypothetical protein